MDKQPLVSVLIPNYNRGSLLAETLQSLLQQSYANWEAIVVDDESSDNSDQIGNEYANLDNRINYFKRSRLPKGAPTCRNLAFELSKGDFIIYLDSDDLLAPFCLEQRINKALFLPDYDFWVFPMLIFNDDPQQATMLWNKANERPALIRFLQLDAVWQTSGPMWTRESIYAVGGFTEGLACWQDVDFHLKALTKNFKFIVTDDLKPDIYYRKHISGSISQGEINTPPKMQSRQQIFFANALALPQPMSQEIKNALKVLGSNVVVGAIKAYNRTVAAESMKFAMKHKIFSRKEWLKFKLLHFLYLSRLHRFRPFSEFTRRIIQYGKVESGIGKHTYQAPN